MTASEVTVSEQPASPGTGRIPKPCKCGHQKFQHDGSRACYGRAREGEPHATFDVTMSRWKCDCTGFDDSPPLTRERMRELAYIEARRCACGHVASSHPVNPGNSWRPCRVMLHSRYFAETLDSPCPCSTYRPEPGALPAEPEPFQRPSAPPEYDPVAEADEILSKAGIAAVPLGRYKPVPKKAEPAVKKHEE